MVDRPGEPVRPVSAQTGNPVDGFGRVDLPLLASYSRSGTNWVRYIIEVISDRPTPGQLRVHRGGNFYIDRAHRAFPVMAQYPSVVLLLRDYRECLLRHHLELWHTQPDVSAFLGNESIDQPPEWYIRNIAAFDAYSGPKMLLCYEDLLSDPHTRITALIAFLGLDRSRGTGFLHDYDHHFRTSVAAYTRFGHQSLSTPSNNLRYHADSVLNMNEQRSFDDYYREHYPGLAARYLKRYCV